MPKVKVFIVDDSAVVRQVIASLLAQEPDIEVLGAAADPIFALRHMEKDWPDVIVLDVEMPRMDGITFLRKIMAERPTPVVICSSLTGKGAQTTFDALAAGAVGIVTKPKLDVRRNLIEVSAELIHTVRAASLARVGRLQSASLRQSPLPVEPRHTPDAVPPCAGHAMAQTTERVVAIGTSTGGTQALEKVLTALPRVSPGLVIVQHMPERFTEIFAARLNGLCEIEVREARNDDRVLPGRALIAPGGRHMLLERSGAQYHVEVRDGPLVNRHRPSVDVLFRSVARAAGRNATGIIMTGMGDDGARGLKEMHDAGAYTVAQDEETCVVYGMPKEAVKLGGVDRILPLGGIPAEIVGNQQNQ